ncbi:MAG TPA: hypothetical protein VHU88_20495 [Sporichthyaceae bacterium]|jgi:hypothetical protein|nr:hypothetical protein [Sporichthyaceae bacterium]
MGRHSAPGQSATPPATPPPAGPTLVIEPVRPAQTAPDAPVRGGRHAAARPDVESAVAQVVLAERTPPTGVQHHRHAARPVPPPSQGPGLEVLAWTGFAAVVAWAIIAAGHDLSEATAWALGGAVLVPIALLSLAPAWLRERRARRRDQ